MTGIIALIFTLVFSLAAFADEVQFSNGDRVSGEIQKMEKGVLSVKAPYAGVVQAKWKDVDCLVSEKELIFVLGKEKRVMGRASCAKKGKVQIVSERFGRTKAVSPSDIMAINPTPMSPVTYKASVKSGGSRTDGNTKTFSTNSSADFEARSSRYRFSLEAALNYGEANDEVTSRNYLGGLKYDFFIAKKFYWYLQTLFERDDFQDLDLRSTLGTGPGLQLLDNKKESLLLEGGLSYFNENHKSEKDKSDPSWRWSVAYNVNIIEDRLKFSHFHEGYFGIKGAGSLYLRSKQGFRMRLVQKFFTNLQMDYQYDNRPSPGKKKYDTIYTFGLGYEYDF